LFRSDTLAPLPTRDELLLSSTWASDRNVTRLSNQKNMPVTIVMYYDVLYEVLESIEQKSCRPQLKLNITRIICLTLVFKFARQRSRYIFLLEKTKSLGYKWNSFGREIRFFCVNELILIGNSFFSNAQSSRPYRNKYRI
jgi:hypothetical protein